MVYTIIIMVINITIYHNIMAETTVCKINDECYAYAYNDDYSCFYMEYKGHYNKWVFKTRRRLESKGSILQLPFYFWIFRWIRNISNGSKFNSKEQAGFQHHHNKLLIFIILLNLMEYKKGSFQVTIGLMDHLEDASTQLTEPYHLKYPLFAKLNN